MDPVTVDSTVDRGPSPNIWSRLNVSEGEIALGKICRYRDDFTSLGGVVATNVGSYASEAGAYKSYEDTSCTLKNYSSAIADAYGLARLLITTSASKEVGFEAGYGFGGPFMLTAGATSQLLAFECRFRVNTVSTSADILNLFVGLAEPGRAITDGLISDTDTLGTKDLIGFRMVSGTGLDNRSDTVKTCLGKNGAAERTPVTAKLLVAGTFYKMGFLYDSLRNHLLGWYVDGAEVDYITDDTIAQFPTAHALTPLFALKSGSSGTAGYTMDIDWAMCAQKITGT